LSSAAETVSFCEIVNRLCPGVDAHDFLKQMQQAADRRRRRVRELERQIRGGTYHVPASAVAEAMLAGHGMIVH